MRLIMAHPLGMKSSCSSIVKLGRLRRYFSSISSDTGTRSVKHFGGRTLPDFFDFCETRSIFVRNCLQLNVTHAEPGKLSVTVPLPKPEHEMDKNSMLLGVMDHCGGYTAWTMLGEEHFIGTVNLRADFLNSSPAASSNETQEPIVADGVVTTVDEKFIRTDVTCWNASRTQKLALGRLLFGRFPSPLINNSKQPPANYDEVLARGRAHSDKAMKISIDGWFTNNANC